MIAFIFPGQGSQSVGMGMDVAERFSAARKVFKIADEILNIPLSRIILEGPEENLKLTINTQPAIVACSIALLESLRECGVECHATAGHSIGEFSALYCAGVLSMEDCITLSRARGEYMHAAGEKYPGTLMAVIGLEVSKVEEICLQASQKGVVVVANLNCPGQVVISGEVAAVEEAGRMAQENGASRVVPLEVSAAFHSPLMNEAAEKLSLKLNSVNFTDPEIPIYSNVTGEAVLSGDQMRTLMKKQIVSRVLWEKSIRKMMEDGVDTFVEIGPGKSLAGMLKRIDRRSVVFNVNDVASFEKLAQSLGKKTVSS